MLSLASSDLNANGLRALTAENNTFSSLSLPDTKCPAAEGDLYTSMIIDAASAMCARLDQSRVVENRLEDMRFASLRFQLLGRLPAHSLKSLK